MDRFTAYRVEKNDKAVSASFVEMDEAALDAGEVDVDVRYASINFKDALAAAGRMPVIRRFPCIGGIDAAGVVRASRSARFAAGDPVIVHSHGFGVSHHGGYAPRARVPADWVNAVPKGLSLLQAITIGVAGYTAALAVEVMEANGLAPSKGKVLVNGASGGVASVAIDLLAQRGFHVVAATRKAQESGYLRELGAAEVIDPASLTVPKRPLESALWHGAVDSLGGAALSGLIATMSKDGVIASIGNAMGVEFSTTVMPFILRGVRLVGVNSDNDVDVREHLWRRLASDLRPRHLDRIAQVRPFAELPRWIDAVVNGRAKGRTVIEMPG
ncbi:MAG TPA: acryloyl-CoA reductase [Ramlibacter sp.]|uniref:acrylyl-CoA reductase family protein n=1 Tax=Ramlibacter sp. TaxID=1917967 RepID=UPI002CE0A79D|nr:acryloyl-CoA reductase [Ramlibacter sp.]HVZ42347.1 acryloyl-CoA reductase [Ramlibacter sp.]